MEKLTSKQKFMIFATLALVAGASIHFLMVYINNKTAPPIANIANDAGQIKVLSDAGPMAGIPVPKAYTTKGAWCVCPGGQGCNGKMKDCSCCNSVPGANSSIGLH